MTQNEHPAGTTGPAPLAHRALALALDTLLLNLIASTLLELLPDTWAQEEVGAGLLLVAVYLGWFALPWWGYASFGGRWLGLRLVDARGRPVSAARRLLRGAVLGVVLAGPAGLGPLDPRLSIPVSIAVGMAWFGCFGPLLVPGRLRQGLHDRLAGAWVADRNGVGDWQPAPGSGRALSISLLVGAVASAITLWAVAPDRETWAAERRLVSDLRELPRVRSADVSLTRRYGEADGRWVDVTVGFRSPPAEQDALVRDIARLAAQELRARCEGCGLAATLRWERFPGVPLHHSVTRRFPPADWEALLAPSAPGPGLEQGPGEGEDPAPNDGVDQEREGDPEGE